MLPLPRRAESEKKPASGKWPMNGELFLLCRRPCVFLPTWREPCTQERNAGPLLVSVVMPWFDTSLSSSRVTWSGKRSLRGGLLFASLRTMRSFPGDTAPTVVCRALPVTDIRSPSALRRVFEALALGGRLRHASGTPGILERHIFFVDS